MSISQITHSSALRGAAGIITLLAAVAPTAPALAASEDNSNFTEHVVAVSQPAIVSLENTIHVWLSDQSGIGLNDDLSYPYTTTCTGFIVSEDGGIVTAAHCVDVDGAIENAVAEYVASASGNWTWTDTGQTMTDTELTEWALANFTFTGDSSDGSLVPEIEIFLSNESGGGSLPARIVDTSPIERGSDVALLRIQRSNLPTITVADSDPTVGDAIVSVGYPGSTERVTDMQSAPSFTKGSVTSIRTRSNGLVPVYEIDATMTFGMSGGPTLNSESEVIGLNSFLSSGETRDLGFVSPASMILEMLNRNGIDTTQTGSNLEYHQALDAHFSGDYAAAVEGLTSVIQDQPANEMARTYLDKAQSAVEASVEISSQESSPSSAEGSVSDGAEDQAAADVPPDRDIAHATGGPLEDFGPVGLIVLVVGAGAFGLGRLRSGNKSQPSGPPAPPMYPQHLPS